MEFNFEIGQKYFDVENGQVITITNIEPEKIIVTKKPTNRITYNIENKKAGYFLEDSIYINNLIPVWETTNVRSA